MTVKGEDHMVWKKVETPFIDGVDRALFHPNNKDLMYLGAGKSVWRSNDRAVNFSRELQLPSKVTAIHSIYIPDDRPATVYIASAAGVHQSNNYGEYWQRVYHDANPLRAEALSVASGAQGIYVGTQQGLLFKSHDASSWHTIAGVLKQAPIHQILEDAQSFIFVTDRHIFRSNKATRKLEQIFNAGVFSEDEGIVHEGGLSPLRAIRSAVLHEGVISRLVVVTNRGIFQSRLDQVEWSSIPSGSLPLDNVTSVFLLSNFPTSHGSSTIFIGSTRGVFYLKGETWQSLYKGLETNHVNWLVKGAEKSLYVATDKGLSYLSFEEIIPAVGVNEMVASQHSQEYLDEMIDKISMQAESEPSIQDVHDWAIRYAEVHPEKIQQWRGQARKKAWLPTLSVGMDYDQDWGTSDSIWGSSSSGGTHYIGPDDKTWGKDVGWDVSLSWDFSELIWNNDQTSIDSRSKLMVDLREEILDQVTRLYFERRRVQVQTVTEDLNTLQAYEKQLRIDELTALIDVFTGGQFSKEIEK